VRSSFELLLPKLVLIRRSSLRDERPFIFSAICFVGQYILDGGGEVSDLQKRLWKHVRELSGETLFSKTVKVGAVQALSGSRR
jgi:hypothetical protein